MAETGNTGNGARTAVSDAEQQGGTVKRERAMVGRAVSSIRGDEGIGIAANLFIIRFIYFHMKKAAVFMVEGTEGRKPAAKEFYDGIIPISRSRFGRIMSGEGFSLSTSNIWEMCRTFGIESKYFSREKPCFIKMPTEKPEDPIKETDWMAFFKCCYGTEYKKLEAADSRASNGWANEGKRVKKKDYMNSQYSRKQPQEPENKENKNENENNGNSENKGNKEVKENEPSKDGCEEDQMVSEFVIKKYKKVNKALMGLVHDKYEVDKTSPFYFIVYYFKFGKRMGFNESLDDLKRILKKVNFSEWDRLDIKAVKEYHQELYIHYTYLDTILTRHRLVTERGRKKPDGEEKTDKKEGTVKGSEADKAENQ